MNISMKQKQTHREQTVAKGEGGWEGKDRELGINRCKLLLYRMDK